ncbi:methyltransferase [Pseudomonas sp. LP_7_YM]|uniref:methyltransferase n=1 Tax=Pseudomonas sp. LP_7_YM TaxID=2485137 RepID=UPI00105ECE24|nr:methyltransferase [Pseudomonas sp. LP_7_YM]TDV64566.1 methyltransferase family protein [Pseudomonas sp. LP_7_YM]
MPPHTDDLHARFLALDAFLLAHQHLWKPRPFTHRHLPWEAQHPELSTWLRQRSLEQAETAHNHPERLDAPQPFVEIANQSKALSEVDALPTHPLNAVSSRLSVDVPGRKWQQIEAFAKSLSFRSTPTHWLDWCAGKGHLGRRLAHGGQALTCLEYDEQLVQAGQQLSAKLGIHAMHLHQNVMAADAASRLASHQTPVALHACGDLHVRLMQLASDARCQHMAIAPCCYNRIDSHQYQPLSAEGLASRLTLSLDDLGLPLSETVTAGARVRRQRDTSMARRLAFDLLQRQLRGIDDYLPTPSLPSAWLDKPFADYCRDLAELKHLPAPTDSNWPELEAAGWQRLAQVRNLELVRNLFRRPLELWLILDRALYLQQRNYDVRIGTFCDSHITPRNLLILAELKPHNSGVLPCG